MHGLDGLPFAADVLHSIVAIVKGELNVDWRISLALALAGCPFEPTGAIKARRRL